MLAGHSTSFWRASQTHQIRPANDWNVLRSRNSLHACNVYHTVKRSVMLGIGLLLASPLTGAGALSGCGKSEADSRTEVRFCFFGGYEEWKLWQRMARAFEKENPELVVASAWKPRCRR